MERGEQGEQNLTQRIFSCVLCDSTPCYLGPLVGWLGRYPIGCLVGWSVGWLVGWLAGQFVSMQPIDWLVSQLVGWLAGRFASLRPIGWLIGQAVSWSVSLSISRPIDRLIGWLISQLVGQLVNKLPNWSIGWLKGGSIDLKNSTYIVKCLLFGRLVGRLGTQLVDQSVHLFSRLAIS